MFSCLFTLGYLAGGISAAVNARLWNKWADYIEDNYVPDEVIDEFNLYFDRITGALGAGAVSEPVINIKCIHYKMNWSFVSCLIVSCILTFSYASVYMQMLFRHSVIATVALITTSLNASPYKGMYSNKWFALSSTSFLCRVQYSHAVLDTTWHPKQSS